MQESTLTRIIYVSTATNLLSEKELEAILQKSRGNNARKNITGLLIYSEGNILQVLEGTKQDLGDLYSVIVKDPRHFGFIKLQELTIEERTFSEWSMGFKTVAPEEFKKIEGYLNLREDNLRVIPDDADGTVKDILKMFVFNNK